MKTIAVLYDGTPYTYKWLKTLFWARKVFYDHGYKLVFPTFKSFLPLEKSNQDVRSMLKNKQYDIIFMAFHYSTSALGKSSVEERASLLTYVKDHCGKLVWLDTSDSTGTCLFDVMPYVDVYLKKQILKNKEDYFNPIWGGRVFCDYYHHQLGLEEPSGKLEEFPVLDPQYIDKIKLSWNVGLGDLFISRGRYSYLKPYSMSQPKDTDTIRYEDKFYDTQFRGSGWPSVAGYQRSKIRSLVMEKNGLNCPDVTQKIPYKEYQKEIRNTKTVISPFGWGEICTRDFETFAYGATLIKPSMEHLYTFPDMYIANETYIPIDWDFNNFYEVLDRINKKEFCYKEIAERANAKYKYYRTSDNGKEDFVKHIIANIN